MDTKAWDTTVVVIKMTSEYGVILGWRYQLKNWNLVLCMAVRHDA